MHLNLNILYSLTSTTLRKDSNQVFELAKYAIRFLDKGNPSAKVLERTKMFHTDSFICGVSALAYRVPEPTLLRSEAQEYSVGRMPKMEHARVFGSMENIVVEKAAAANIVAISEWNSNGVYSGIPSNQSQTCSYSSFYPAVIAAVHANQRISGSLILKALVLHDEIRCKLTDAYPWHQHKIDSCVNGALATIYVYGALVGASPQNIENAVGMYICHYSPWLAERLNRGGNHAAAMAN